MRLKWGESYLLSRPTLFSACDLNNLAIHYTPGRASLFTGLEWTGVDWTGVDWTHPKICKMPFSV